MATVVVNPVSQINVRVGPGAPAQVQSTSQFLGATDQFPGTVTSVSGTGTVNGLSLSGTVTTSGSLTLGGTLDLSSPPAIGGTDPAAGKFTTLTATGQTSLGGVAGSESFRALSVASATRWVQAEGSVSGQPRIQAAGASSSFAISGNGANGLTFWSNSFTIQQFAIAHAATAVNYLQVIGSATGVNPTLSVQGSDANLSINYQAKGGNEHRFFSGTGSSEQFRVMHSGGTIVNQTTVTGSVTGAAPIFGVRGTDTNIDLALQTKGTGVLQFGTHTAGILTQTGYITIKDSGGTTRRLLVG